MPASPAPVASSRQWLRRQELSGLRIQKAPGESGPLFRPADLRVWRLRLFRPQCGELRRRRRCHAATGRTGAAHARWGLHQPSLRRVCGRYLPLSNSATMHDRVPAIQLCERGSVMAPAREGLHQRRLDPFVRRVGTRKAHALEIPGSGRGFLHWASRVGPVRDFCINDRNVPVVRRRSETAASRNGSWIATLVDYAFR